MMRKFLTLVFLVFLLTVFVLSIGHADEKNDISRAQDWLNGFSMASGSFVQHDGSRHAMYGVFHISKPGKIRFDYNAPDKLVVISDGTWIGVNDGDGPFQRYPLSETPLGILLATHVDLLKDFSLLHNDRIDNTVQLTFKDKGDAQPGNITLVFYRDPFVLAGWIVKDANGALVYITLKDVKYGAAQEVSDFVIPQDIRPDIRGRQQ